MLIQELSSLLEMRMAVAEFSNKSVGEREQILWQWAKGGMNAISLKEWKTYLNAHIQQSKDTE